MKRILEYKSQKPIIDLTLINKHFDINLNLSMVKKLLNSAVEHLELERGISLQQKIWKLFHNNNIIILSDAPIIKIISICDSMNRNISPISSKRHNDNIVMHFDENVKNIQVAYEVGYTEESLPECLKNSILQKFWDLYAENYLDDFNEDNIYHTNEDLDSVYLVSTNNQYKKNYCIKNYLEKE